MKENKLEITLTIIMSILILLLIIFTIFKVYNSTSSLRINEIPKKTNSISNAHKNNSNNNASVNNSSNTSNLNMPKEKIITNFSTNIYDNDVNRVHNIALAIEKINGYILNPGDTFSFNETVGPMDFDHGFKESTAFDAAGNKIKVPGGGMCQISSTMYCAALEANLEIIERHPHSRRVEYVPIDRDATIYYDTLDFKFKNNTENKIKITATSDQYNVTINLYSIEN